MKKYLFIFTAILFIQISFSQNDTVYISGKVTANNSLGNEEAIKKAYIHLKLSNGFMLESISNDSGYYYFKVKTFQGVGELTKVTDKNTSFINSKSYGFIANRDIGKLNFTESSYFIKKFKLDKQMSCGPTLPKILFKYNSLAPFIDNSSDTASFEYSTPEVSIKFIFQFLNENPTIVIELQGHCDSREKNPKTLSLQRAGYLQQALTNKGIDKERILIKGWGAKKLLVKGNVILKATTKEEKEKLHLQNRRVVLRIINWDYIPKENNKSPK